MNNKICNLVLICFFSTFGLFAQSKKTYQKSFKVNKDTQLNFETQNVDVVFKTWDKDEVKLDFIVEFDNYSEKEIKEISNGIVTSTQMESRLNDEQYLHIRTASITSIGRLSYQLKEDNYISITNLGDESKEKNSYRSVAEINKEIASRGVGIKEMSGYIITKKDSIPLADIDKSKHTSIQRIRSAYNVYIPNYMMLRITAANANVDLEGKFINPIKASLVESTLKADELAHEKNQISVMNGTVKIKKITGGSYAFKNVTNGLFGQLEAARIQTEFSKVTIGEIVKDVAFRDFKSNFFIHKLGENFTSITMECEYSDIKLYTNKNQKYYLKAIGHNAVLKDGDIKVIIQPNRNHEKTNMFTRGEDTTEYRKNMFKLDITHGFVTLLHLD